MEQPYVGIKGFTSRHEVESVLAAAPDMQHAVMIGMLMNEELLSGKPVRHPRRYPDVRQMDEIFTNHARALNLVCYQTKAMESLFDQLCEIRELIGKNLHGFQFDFPELPISALERVRLEWPGMKISMRINREMFRKSGHRPEILASAVRDCSGWADYAYIDFTNGDGIPCSPDLLRNLLNNLKSAEVPIRLGIGGGLGVYTLSPLKQLLREIPDLCLEGDFRLRDEEDRLDIPASGEFLARAARLLAAE